ncbi:thioredoxin domain-containing protein [Nocardia sp. NPDC050712]|uniref:thioredoxin family protein n=1 Tax=Nocardia sp. NPDC050712 TaxID=3155518 RepID=UPI0033DBFCF8
MPTVTLTQQNFHTVVAGNNIVLVDWWAGWCGPCTHFAPVYEDSSDRHSDIVYGKVDTEAEVQLTAMAQVDRFPTLMGFREGLLVFNQAGFLPAGDLEEVVQQIMWLDMDAVRQAAAQAEAQVREGEAHVESAVEVRGGLAAGPARYGWPGL